MSTDLAAAAGATNASTGTVAILNVGTGDTKISFDPTKPAERKRASRIVKDMLRRGYALLVAAGEKDGRPLFFRATDFDPKTCEYIVAGDPQEEVFPPAKRGRPPRRIPAETTRAVSVARSAGGMSAAADSIESQSLTYAKLRGAFRRIAEDREQWAGIPLPMDGVPLVIEPRYPNADALMKVGRTADESELSGTKVRSRFYSTQKRCDIGIIEQDGRIDWGFIPAVHHGRIELHTLMAADAWDTEQESRALQTLASLITERQFNHYLLTGSFLESSKRSRLFYLFRRLRPTIALGNGKTEQDTMTIRAALCMHPIAYYEGTWSGAMCPTDDVIAHLMLMRGDEHMYWRRCNQHPSWRPEAGL